MTADGRYQPGKHWNRWAVYDLASNPPPVAAGPYDTEDQARTEAARLNTPKPRPAQQQALFGPQET